jgi:hypothetical protein
LWDLSSEQIAVRAGANQDEATGFQLENEEPVWTDVALTVVCPFAAEMVRVMPRLQGVVGGEPADYFKKIFDLVATGVFDLFQIFSEL